MKKILTKSLVLAVAVFLSVLFIAPAIVTAATTTTEAATTTTEAATTTTEAATTTTAGTTTTTAPAATTTTVTGGQIPTTATPWYNVLVVGVALMLIGALGWITIKKRARQ